MIRNTTHNCDVLPSKIRPGQSAAGIVIKPIRLTGSIPVIATLLVAGLGVAAPTSTARAKDCLAAPNSPAPEGKWWYYRPRLAHSTQMLVFAFAREAGA